MTRETKIGLLVGMGVIILIGILISDHLSVAQRQQQAQVARNWPEVTPDAAPDPMAAIVDPIRQHQPEQPLGPLPQPRGADNAIASDPDIIRQHYPEAYDLTPARQDEPFVAADPIDRTPTPSVADRTPTVDQRLASDPAFEIVRERPLSRDEVIRIREAVAHSGGAGPKPQYHTIKDGERLSDIARQYYGDARLFPILVDANKAQIPNPNVVRAGVRIVIPPKPGTEPAPAPGATPAPAPAPTARGTTPAPAAASGAQYAEYTIKDGEYLSTIAARYYGSPGAWTKLYEINKDRISNPNVVKPGTVIRVPKSR